MDHPLYADDTRLYLSLNPVDLLNVGTFLTVISQKLVTGSPKL